MKVINKEILVRGQSTRITQLAILAPDIAKRILPGQFVVLMTREEGERIPLTVASKGEGDGIINIIVQEVGLTTKLLGMLNAGDSLYALAGPLGHPAEIKNYGKVIIIGGGVGVAEIYLAAQALKNVGNHVATIIGAKSKDILILEEELKNTSDELYVTTDDGSYARKGFTTDVLAELLKKDTYNLIYAVGPIPMMKKVSQATRTSGIKTIVSLNALMVDATGMCGCCRVTIAGKTKFSCVDGPEFDGHLVDWEELEKRNKIYLDKEKKACTLLTALNKK